MSKKISNGRVGLVIIALLLIAAVSASVYLVSKNQNLMHLGLDLQGASALL